VTLWGHIKEFEAKLAGKKPPTREATDLPKAPDKKAPGRKPGGRPGHAAHFQNLVPTDRVNKSIVIAKWRGGVGKANAAILRAFAQGIIRVVDVRGHRGRRADEKPRRTGAAFRGDLAASSLPLQKRGSLAIR
jgi:hypothetical protein